MYKVILIDDEPLARQLIATLLQSYNQFDIVAQCCDGFEGFKNIQLLQPDLIFLDVQMPKVNGFEMLELLEQTPSVIFTTAFDEYAMKAFEAHAIDYLLKPISKQRLDKAIQKWMIQKQGSSTQHNQLESLFKDKIIEGYQHRIVVKENGMIRIIQAQDIHYVEACDDYIKIFTKDGYHLKKSTLTKLEQTFDPIQFIRVHRSYFIPVSQLLSIEPYEKDGHLALLQCGAKVPVSKSGFSKLKQVLGW